MPNIIDDVAAILGRGDGNERKQQMVEMLNRHGFYFSRVTNDAPTRKEAKDLAIDISKGLDARVKLEERLEGQINKARAQKIGLNLERPIYPHGFIRTNQGWLCPKCGAGNAPTTATCPCVPMIGDISL